jgi:type IX secretion system PorP/SprF family membrane protein
MHNLSVFNPAYYSLDNKLVVTSYLREQWAGIKGAPTTKSLVAGVDIDDRHSINFNISQDAITIFNDLNIGLGYNYRINFSKSTLLSFGIKGDVGFINADYTSLNVQESGDDLLNNTIESKKYVNMGAGIFLQSANYFVSFSMPHLFKNSIDKSKDAILNRRLKFNHTYLSMGNKFEFEDFTFTPTTLIKVV